MSYAAKTVLTFGVYMLAQGAILLIAPNVLLRLVQLPETSEPWIRAVGIAVFVLGFYYVAAAKAELTAFFGWTVYMRTFQLLAFVALVALGIAETTILLFSCTEFIFGLWTLAALRTKTVER